MRLPYTSIGARWAIRRQIRGRGLMDMRLVRAAIVMLTCPTLDDGV